MGDDVATRLLAYVQYVHGVGHLQRISAIAREILQHSAGAEVTLAVGGLPVPNIRDALVRDGVHYVQLPPASQPPGSWKLLDVLTGKPVTREWKSARRDTLLTTLAAVRPHVLLVELYPFGRRKFHFELVPLLDAAHALGEGARPAVLVSVRDYLVRSFKPHSASVAAGVVRGYVDQVLVHSDPAVVRFSETFDMADGIAHKLAYTGYVHGGGSAADAAAAVPTLASSAPSSASPTYAVIAVGGGGNGDPIAVINAALGCRDVLMRESAAYIEWEWWVYVGHYVSDAAFEGLVAAHAATRGVHIVRAVPHAVYLARLSDARCAAVLCMGGYNTVVELAALAQRASPPTQRPAVVVLPAQRKGDTEQLVRARRFAQRGLCAVVAEAPSEPGFATLLAAAVTAERARLAAVPALALGASSVDIDGAAMSARLIAEWAKQAASRFAIHAMRAKHGRAEERALFVAPGAAPSAAPGATPLPPAPAPPSPYADAALIAPLAPRLTVVLLHYKRAANVRRILDTLAQQRVSLRIFLWNNSGTPFRDERIAWQVDSSLNRFCWPRWLAASLASTPFVCVMDDDHMPGDPDVLGDAVEWLHVHGGPNTIVGPQGLVLRDGASYRNGTHVNAHKEKWPKRDAKRDANPLPGLDARGVVFAAAAPADLTWSAWQRDLAAMRALPGSAQIEAALRRGEEARTSVAVDIIKGRMMMLSLSALRARAGFLFGSDDRRGDDIAISGALAARRRRHHRVLRLFSGRMTELPAPHALCDSGDHYELREDVRRRFFSAAAEEAPATSK